MAGPRRIGAFIIALLASLFDATVRVEKVSWSEDNDGAILANRWLLEETPRPGGLLGVMLDDKPVSVTGMSYLRFGNGHIVKEETLLDEVGILAQAYRA